MLRFILFLARMEDVFDAEDDEHSEDDVAEDDEQRVPEIFESHGSKKHGGDLIDGGQNQRVEENPTEVLDTGYGTVDVLELDVVGPVEHPHDVGAEEHQQGAGKGRDAKRVRECIHHEARGETDEILQRQRQFQRQQEQRKQEQCRRHITEQVDMLADGNLCDEQQQKPQYVGNDVIHL